MAGTEQAAWRRYAATPLVTHKDNASALGGGIISTALILLRHRFLWQFRPNSRYLLLIRHRPIHSRIFSKALSQQMVDF